MTAGSSPSPPHHSSPITHHSISPPRLTMLVVCVVSVYFIVGFYSKSVESYRINQRAAQVRQEVAELESQNEGLQARVAYLATDTYVETAARDKLNLVRPGDRSLVIVPEQSAIMGPAGPPPRREPSRFLAEFGHFEEWLALFFSPR
ncbi:MAG: FtsB family cell division protein [Chloroflexota bacterium]